MFSWSELRGMTADTRRLRMRKQTYSFSFSSWATINLWLARPSSSTVQHQQGNNTTQRRVMQNFRSLFAAYFNRLFLCCHCKISSSEKNLDLSGQSELDSWLFFLSWVHAICFCAVTCAKIVPRNAGLGRRKVFYFSCKGTAIDVKKKVQSV